MNTTCTQTRLDCRGDLMAATGLDRIRAERAHKGVYAGAAELFSRLAAGFVRARRRREAISELSRLSNRQLSDIGIPREQIREVVDGLLAKANGHSDHAGP